MLGQRRSQWYNIKTGVWLSTPCLLGYYTVYITGYIVIFWKDPFFNTCAYLRELCSSVCIHSHLFTYLLQQKARCNAALALLPYFVIIKHNENTKCMREMINKGPRLPFHPSN